MTATDTVPAPRESIAERMKWAAGVLDRIVDQITVDTGAALTDLTARLAAETTTTSRAHTLILTFAHLLHQIHDVGSIDVIAVADVYLDHIGNRP